MKQRDIALIVMIVVIAAIFSLIVSRSLFGGDRAKQEVERVQSITQVFNEPDPRYFNAEAFNPTKKITIGDSTSDDPFSGR